MQDPEGSCHNHCPKYLCDECWYETDQHDVVVLKYQENPNPWGVAE